MFLRRRKAQSTIEYGILIGIVVTFLVGMQIYVNRGLNSRMKDGVDNIPGIVEGNEGSGIFTSDTKQYDPYYSREGSAELSSTSSPGTEKGAFSDQGGAIEVKERVEGGRTGSQTYVGTDEAD